MSHRDEVFATGIAAIEVCIVAVQSAQGDTPEQLRACILKLLTEMRDAAKKKLVS
jgi:hypothetical protein